MTVLGLVAPGRVSGVSKPVRGPASKGRSGRAGRSGNSKGAGKRNVHTRKPGNYRPNLPAPPLPDPLPPAPLLKPTELVALGVLVAAQVWGRWNQRDTSGHEPLPPDTNVNVVGSVGAQGGSVSVKTVRTFARGAGCSDTGSITTTWPSKGVVAGYGQLRVVTGAGGGCGSIGSFTISCNTKASTWSYVGSDSSGNLNPAGDFTSLAVTATYTPTGTPVSLPQPWEIPPFDWVERPEIEPVPELQPVAPAIAPPQIAPLPVPVSDPAPGETQREVTQPGSGTAKAPAQVVIVRPWRPRPKPPTTGVIEDGQLQKPQPQPPQVTPPDEHFPVTGEPGIPGNGPQPKPEEIAKEVGRIEKKLEMLLNKPSGGGFDPDLLAPLGKILEMLQSMNDGVRYTITERCPPCDGGPYDPPSVIIDAAGGLNALEVIKNRIDALALLMDGKMGLKQVVCPPCFEPPQGASVAVQFRSNDPSPYGDKRLRKVLRYRDQTSTALADHRDHWKEFTWTSGPWMVLSDGLPWGRPQVWAASPAEGQRVLRHAAAIAGVDLADVRHKWVIREIQGVREHPEMLMRVHKDIHGVTWVTQREGPNGLPYAVPG